jgi:hypothetical protein
MSYIEVYNGHQDVPLAFRQLSPVLECASITEILHIPYVTQTISVVLNETSGTIRFKGHFLGTVGTLYLYVDNIDNAYNTIRTYMTVRIVDKVIGPSTSSYGNPIDDIKRERILAAAAASAPFEPICVPEETINEVVMKEQEYVTTCDRVRRLREADKDYDDIMDYGIPSNIIDLRFDVLECTERVMR